MDEDGKVTVVCEKVLNGRCGRTEGCAATSENRVSYPSTKATDSGQRYYPYNCPKNGNSVRLLDIHFKLKNNPNFLFKHRKRR